MIKLSFIGISIYILAFFILIPKTYADYCHGKPGEYFVNHEGIWKSQPRLLRTHQLGKLYEIGENTTTMKMLHVYGNMYQMGFAHGALLKQELNTFMSQLWQYIQDQIIDGLPKKIPKFLQTSTANFAASAALDLTYQITKPYTNNKYYEEMRGVADGSGVPFSLFKRVSMIGQLTKGSCSMFGAWGNATSLGQTVQLRALDWDFDGPYRKYPLVIVYHPQKTANNKYGNSWMNIGFAGWLGVISGVNQHKLGVSQIGVYFKDQTFGKQSRVGNPFTFVLRDVLQWDKSIEDSITRLQKTKRTCNLILGVGDGRQNGYFRSFQYSHSVMNAINDTHPLNTLFQEIRFYVTFSSQNVVFNSLALFKMELQKGKKYDIYLDVKLSLTHVKLNKKKDSKKQIKKGDDQFNKKVTTVDQRRIFFNNIKWINSFRRIIFSQPEFFSYVDVYFVSIKTGDKIRPYDFQLGDFFLMPIQQKTKIHLEDKPGIDTQSKRNLYCFNGNNVASSKYSEIKTLLRYSICDFYDIMICLPVKNYKKLALVYQHFRAMSLSMNNSTIIEEIRIQYLQWMGKQAQFSSNNLGSEEALMEYYQTENYFEIYLEIMNESKMVYQNVQWLFDKLIELILKLNFNIFQFLANLSIEDVIKAKYKKMILYGEIKGSRKEAHTNFIKIRQDFCSQSQIYQDLDLKHPFIMIQASDLNETKTGQPQIKKHRSRSLINSNLLGATSLIVFVHGYQGTQVDLQIAKYFLQLHNLSCFCLLSQAIQDDMDETIQFLGKKLAEEVISHIERSHNRYNKLNFIGYSLGGIIVREAMKHLSKYKAIMNLFISFASPHIGTVDGNNYLVRTGIWYLINFQKAKNIKQLHCQADQNHEISLKKLSECQSLSWFQKFIVVSSQQDGFVPYTSSRLDEDSESNLTKQMCNNIKKRIKKLQRVEVWFDVDHNIGTMDKVLGRRAHIQFLENRVFLDCFFKLYANQL